MVEVKSVSQYIEEVSPYYQGRAKKKENGEISMVPEFSHTLIYDSSSETLEPIYFYLLDLMNDMRLGPEKLEDNFSSTVGSGHFSELGQRATIMQQQASKLLGDANTVIRSILNLVYDLKEFKMRLQHYDNLKSSKKEEQEASRLALKQIWMDKVDINKGNSSIKAMALGQSGYQLLIDAFLVANTEADVDKTDLNDRVKRAVKPRVQEFNIWLKESEIELRKRYDLEKNYLKSQVNSLKLYSKWARPYLKAAQDLEQKESTNPALVKTFNTIVLELTLFGKEKLDLADESVKYNIPKFLTNPTFLEKEVYGIGKNKRDYYACTLVSFTFRGIPQKISQQSHYAFGGRAEVTFKAYALNEEEIKKFKDEIKKAELNDAFGLIEGTTKDGLDLILKDVNSFLEEKSDEPKEEKDTSNPFLALFKKGDKTEEDQSNPFLALLGRYEKKGNPKQEKNKKEELTVRPDSQFEKDYFRKIAAENAKQKIFDLFDTYKKSHGMNSYT